MKKKDRKYACKNCGQLNKPEAHDCPHGKKCNGTCKAGWPCSAEPKK